MSVRYWDDGVRWHLEQVEAPSEQPLSLPFVRDKHLKLTNGNVEDYYIGRLIRVSTMLAEHKTKRPLVPQTWAWVADRFPCWEICLPKPPLLEVVSVEYIDSEGAEQTLDPSEYQVSAPQGPKAPRGRLAPAANTSWPTIGCGYLDPVRVTFRCGYEDATVSPPQPNIPEDILQGQLLAIGEMYKHRSESLAGMTSPGVRRALDLWLEYRVY